MALTRHKKLSKKLSKKPTPRPRPQPRPDPVLKSEHSFDLVRTAITATMFQVVWTRDAIPRAKWNSRFFDPTDPDTSYDSFISGPATEVKSGGLRWNVPARGEVKEADKLISRLEVGVKDALAKKYLHKVQLSFHQPGTDPISDQNALESYAMTVTYSANGTGPHLSTEIRRSQSPESNNILVLDGKNELKDMVDKVVKVLFDFKKCNGKQIAYKLPAGARMSMQLEYTPDTPLDYEPEAFHPAGDNIKRLLDINQDKNEDLTMRTGFHSVAFNFNSPGFKVLIQDSQPDDEGGSRNVSLHPSRDCNNKVFLRNRHLDVQRASSMFSASDGGHTQLNDLETILNAGSFRVLNSSTQDTQPYFTHPTSLAQGQSSHTGAPAIQSNIPQYTQDIHNELEYMAQQMEGQGGDDNNDAPQGTDISCECRATTTDEALIKCVSCSGFQHAECYGYLHDTPDLQFCYTCLNLRFPERNVKLDERKDDCLMRRAIRFFQARKSLRTLEELTAHLERPRLIIGHVLDRLVRKDYIVKNRTTVGGQKKPGSPMYTFIAGDAKVQEYFDPRHEINHLFALPSATPDTSMSEGTTESGSFDGDSRHKSMTSPSHPQASYSKGLLTITGLRISSPRATSADDATTQSASNMTTPSRPTRGGCEGPPFNASYGMGRDHRPLHTPREVSTTQGTPSTRSYTLKRVAKLSLEDRPARRRKASEMSPMVVRP